MSCQNRTNILKIWLVNSRFPLLPERIAVYVKTTWFNFVWSNILCDTQALYASKYIVCRCVYDISFKMLHFKVFLWTHLELYNSISFVHVCEFWNILKIDHINFTLIYSLKYLFSELFSRYIFWCTDSGNTLTHQNKNCYILSNLEDTWFTTNKPWGLRPEPFAPYRILC